MCDCGQQQHKNSPESGLRTVRPKGAKEQLELNYREPHSPCAVNVFKRARSISLAISRIGKGLLSIDKDSESLCDFGLTRNQAKVYLAVLQLGLASVGSISTESRIRREDVYRTLPKLEKLGLIEKTLGTPVRVKAIPFEKALSALIRNQRTKISRMRVKKQELLEKYQKKTCRDPDHTEEENQFVLLSDRELILDKITLMIKKATEQIDIVSTSENFFRYLPNFARSLAKASRDRERAQFRTILDMERSRDSIAGIQEKEKAIPSEAPVHIRYSFDAMNPLVIVDGKEVLMGTSARQIFGAAGDHRYLWSTNRTLAKLLQKSFEEQWHLSAGKKAAMTELAPDKIKTFAKQLRPGDYVIFVYDSQETKNNVLFNCVEAGLENREVVVYVTSEANPHEIREGMKQFGIDVTRHGKNGALHVLNYDEIYLVDGKFNFSTITGRWKSLYDEALSKGFKGLRAVGEMGCFFKHNLLSELTEYEQTVHQALEPPIIGICVYQSNMFNMAKDPVSFYNELVRVHRIVLFTGVDKAIRKYEIRNS